MFFILFPFEYMKRIVYTCTKSFIQTSRMASTKIIAQIYAISSTLNKSVYITAFESGENLMIGYKRMKQACYDINYGQSSSSDDIITNVLADVYEGEDLEDLKWVFAEFMKADAVY